MKKRKKKALILGGLLAGGIVTAATYWMTASCTEAATDTVAAAEKENLSGKEVLRADQSSAANEKETDAGIGVRKDVYPIGSVSKTFGAVAILKLADEGKIDLNRPVTDYLPEFTMKDPRYKDITVRMLLSHSSGIMGDVAGGTTVLGDTDRSYHDHYLEKLSQQTLKADPGEYSVYCNTGFMVVELLVERVSGMDFSEYLNQEIAGPLHLDSTGSTIIGPDKEHYVTARINGREVPYINCQEIADGAMLSTTDDLCRFGQIFMEDNHFLSDQSKALMMENWSAKDKVGYVEGDSFFRYGLGLDGVGIYPYNQYGLTAVAKGGNIGNFQTTFTVLPKEKLTVAITGQGGRSEECELMAQDIILSVLKEEGLIDGEELSMEKQKKELYGGEVTEGMPVPEEIKEYAGLYGSIGLYRISFEKEGQMRMETVSGSRKTGMDFYYCGDGTFVAANGDFIGFQGDFLSDSGQQKGCSKVWFQKEANGQLYLMGQYYEEKVGVGRSAISGAVAEKVPECRADQKAIDSWKEREGSWYFLVNEPYNSMAYLTTPIGKIYVNEGYVNLNTVGDTYEKNAAVILDENTCDSNLDVPLMASRDLINYMVFEKDGQEYLTGAGDTAGTYRREQDLLNSSELSGICSFGEDGFAKWYRISPEDEGKLVTFLASEKAGYFVYDKNGDCIFSSLYQKAGNKVILPKNGYIALAGEKGQTVEMIR